MNNDDNGAPSPPAEGEASAPQGEQLPTETSQLEPSSEPSENFQKRIDTVIGQRNDARLETESLRQKLNAQNQVTIPVSDTSEPTLEAFGFDEDKFQSALIDHRVQKGVSAGLNEFARAQQVAAQQVQNDSRVNVYNQRAQDFSSQTPDFVEKVGGLQLTADAQSAIMASDVGPQVAYAIANEPGLAAEMNRLDPMSAAMRVGEMAVVIRANGVSNKISTAPDPIAPPAGQGGAIKTAELNQMSMDEFMANQGVVKTSR